MGIHFVFACATPRLDVADICIYEVLHQLSPQKSVTEQMLHSRLMCEILILSHYSFKIPTLNLDLLQKCNIRFLKI